MLLPIGTDNFKKIIDNKTIQFIDKSLFIKDIFDDSATEVSVITRPRRFGKTLALSMLHHFLSPEINRISTKGLFDNLEISQCGEEYMQHQGKYPVIFVTFKGVKDRTFEGAKQYIATLMSEVYSEHKYLLESPHLDAHQKETFDLIFREKANELTVRRALFNLTKYLYQHTNVKPWLLIDEYDTPMQAAYVNNLDPSQTKVLLKEDEKRINYYSNMMHLMRTLLGDVLKTNPYLHRAVITGILRIAKESLFSDLNNLRIYSILSERYSEHFGFTESEVETILKQTHLTDKADEIKKWYNGYQVGSTVVYNPWSIANCVDEKGFMQTYWVNTSDNQLIKVLLKKSSLNFKEQFEHLIQGSSITCFINENMVFQYLDGSPTAVWSLLLMSGYLKPLSSRLTHLGTECELAIPNREVRDLYTQIIAQWLADKLEMEWFKSFIESLTVGDIATFKKGLDNIILQITSCHDVAREPEAFYHGLMLGFLACLHHNGYDVQSNKESGYGRYDIMIIPDDKTKLGVIIELKNGKCSRNVGAKNLSPETPIPENNHENPYLIKLAQEAIQQIDEKKYAESLKQQGIGKILKVGIGFCGKQFELVSAEE